MAERHLTLFVPGFRQAPVPVEPDRLATFLRLGCLERFLARADAVAPATKALGLEAAVFGLFGIALDSRLDPPTAAVTYYLDSGERVAGWYLRVDPVHLRVDLNRLILFDASTFPLSDEEAHQLAGEVRGLLERVGGELMVFTPSRWYLRFQQPPDIRTRSLLEVAGRDVHAQLPEGEAGADWRRLLNEIQMTLHRSPLNQAREERGEPAVNSLWFWGGGRLPGSEEGRWDRVYSGSPLGQGLARLSGAAVADCPSDGDAWLQGDVVGRRQLVLVDTLENSARYGDMEDWMAQLDHLERGWMVALWEGLKSRRFTSLTLVDDRGFGRRCTRLGTVRWWRRGKPFTEYLTRGEEP